MLKLYKKSFNTPYYMNDLFARFNDRLLTMSFRFRFCRKYHLTELCRLFWVVPGGLCGERSPLPCMLQWSVCDASTVELYG